MWENLSHKPKKNSSTESDEGRGEEKAPAGGSPPIQARLETRFAFREKSPQTGQGDIDSCPRNGKQKPRLGIHRKSGKNWAATGEGAGEPCEKIGENSQFLSTVERKKRV